MDVDIELIIILVVILFIPAIPGIVLWYWLVPVTFWQKLATLVVSCVFYVLLLMLELSLLRSVEL